MLACARENAVCISLSTPSARNAAISSTQSTGQPASGTRVCGINQAPACAEASYSRWISQRWPAAHSCHCQSCALEQVVRLVAAAKKEHRCAQGLAVAPRRAPLLRHGTGPLGEARAALCAVAVWRRIAAPTRLSVGGRQEVCRTGNRSHLEDRSHRSHAGADAHLHSPAQMERGTASPAV